jgi:hypothetical protein
MPIADKKSRAAPAVSLSFPVLVTRCNLRISSSILDKAFDIKLVMQVIATRILHRDLRCFSFDKLPINEAKKNLIRYVMVRNEVAIDLKAH